MNLKELKKIYAFTIDLIRNEDKDLTERQKGVLLTVYLNDELQTIRSLSSELKVPKASISRAVSTLEKYGFLRKMNDVSDKRSVKVKRTVKGSVFMDNWNDRIKEIIDS